MVVAQTKHLTIASCGTGQLRRFALQLPAPHAIVMNLDVLAAYRESERAIIEGRPTWATGAFAIALFGGPLGCLLLLLRKSAAYYLFITSLVGMIVTMTHTLGVGIDFGPGEVLGFILMLLVVAAFLVCYSRQVESKAWVNQQQQMPG